MQYCPKCKMYIRGSKKCCPLCRGDLTGEAESPAFPVVDKQRNRGTFLKVLSFVCAVVVVVMLLLMTLLQRRWPLLFIAISATAWVDILAARYYRYNIVRLITFETFLGMLICFVIDKYFNMGGWSYIWAIPFSFVGLIIATVMVLAISRLPLEDGIIYIIFDILMSLLLLIGVVNGQNTFPIPVMIIEAGLGLLGIAILIFRFRDLKNASGKWFNV